MQLRTEENLKPGHAVGVWAVAISDNDQLLFTGSQDHTIKIWRMSTNFQGSQYN